MELKNARTCNNCNALEATNKHRVYRCQLRYRQGLADNGWERIPLESCPKPLTNRVFLEVYRERLKEWGGCDVADTAIAKPETEET